MKARRRYNSGHNKVDSGNNNKESQTNANRGTHQDDLYCYQHQVSTDSIEEENDPSDDKSGLWIPDLNFIPPVHFYVWIVAASLYCYANSISGDLVHDDIYAIKNNQDILPETPLSNIFIHDYWGKPLSDPTSHKSYRPLTTLTFRFNHLLSGFTPRGYHCVNIVLHMITSDLYTYICKSLIFKDDVSGYLAGLLFTVHPIHTEAVTNIVGRADVLACLFFLLGFLHYAWSISENRKDSRGFARTSSLEQLAMALMSGTAAMFFKEHGATILGVFLVYDIFIVSKKGLIRIFFNKYKSSNCGPFIKRCAIVSVTGLFLLVVRLQLLHGELPNFSDQDNPASHSPYLLTRFLTYCYLVAFNIYLLICPITLSYDWQVGSIPLVESLWDVRNLATALVFGTLGVLLWHAYNAKEREQRVIILGLTFLILPFLPASNMLITVGFVVAERILYIPSMGFCILLIHGISKLCKVSGGRFAKITTILAFAMVFLYGIRTHTRNWDWQTRETLFKSGVETLPHNAKMHYNWANYLKDNGRKPEAISHYQKCLELYPNHTSAFNNLGTLLTDDDPEEAESIFRQAISVDPYHSRAHYNLANTLVRKGNYEEAKLMYEAAMDLDPTYIDPYTNLAVLHEKQGEVQTAENLYRIASLLLPNSADECNNYAVFLTRHGKHEEALDQYQKCIYIPDNRKVTHVNVARLLRHMGKTTDAEYHYLRALQIEKDADTLQKLGALYYNTERVLSAKAVYEEAIALSTNNLELQMQYAQILVQLDRPQNALTWLLDGVIKLYPNHVAVHRQVASIYSMQNKFSEALQYIDKALSFVPESDNEMKGQVLFEKGNIYRELQKNDSAIESYQRAVQLHPSFGSAHMNLAGMWHLQGNYRLAKQHYTIALRYDPQNKMLLENIAKISRLEYNKTTSNEINTGGGTQVASKLRYKRDMTAATMDQTAQILV
ncbi:protein O-mannosyl-transferase TMTC1-like isoform X2 [Amphiura filiformis]|uniref:protein O-mannosyl-transferase TMTC1-like isoform X2 n=1 Tax=Amphiura filiformis TaxID=82378 RepID=UPI003B219402